MSGASFRILITKIDLICILQECMGSLQVVKMEIAAGQRDGTTTEEAVEGGGPPCLSCKCWAESSRIRNPPGWQQAARRIRTRSPVVFATLPGDSVQVVVCHRGRQWLVVYRQAFQLVLDGVQQKDPNSPCLISRVDGVQVVVCHIVLLVVLVAEEAHLSDPRLSSGQQVAVVTPLVAEVGHAEVVWNPSVAEVGHAEVVVDPSVAVVGQVAVDTPWW